MHLKNKGIIRIDAAFRRHPCDRFHMTPLFVPSKKTPVMPAPSPTPRELYSFEEGGGMKVKMTSAQKSKWGLKTEDEK